MFWKRALHIYTFTYIHIHIYTCRHIKNIDIYIQAYRQTYRHIGRIASYMYINGPEELYLFGEICIRCIYVIS